MVQDRLCYFCLYIDLDQLIREYNADGNRTSKTVGGIKHEYLLNGSQIIAERWGNSGAMLVYLYDESGSPIGMKYRTAYYAEGVYDSYFFEKNLQGDIVAIYNASGTKIGTGNL